MMENTRQSKLKLGKTNFIHHDTTIRDKLKQGEKFMEPGQEQKLCKYDINGFLYASSTRNAPPPEQDEAPAHWVCMVNGTTNQYNIINNQAPNPCNYAYRKWEVSRFRETNAGKTVAAGATQPAPVITCHEMPAFVPIRHKIYPNYALVKPNL